MWRRSRSCARTSRHTLFSLSLEISSSMISSVATARARIRLATTCGSRLITNSRYRFSSSHIFSSVLTTVTEQLFDQWTGAINGARVEGKVADLRHEAQDRHRCKRRAPVEGTPADPRHRCWRRSQGGVAELVCSSCFAVCCPQVQTLSFFNKHTKSRNMPPSMLLSRLPAACVLPAYAGRRLSTRRGRSGARPAGAPSACGLPSPASIAGPRPPGAWPYSYARCSDGNERSEQRGGCLPCTQAAAGRVPRWRSGG